MNVAVDPYRDKIRELGKTEPFFALLDMRLELDEMDLPEHLYNKMLSVLEEAGPTIIEDQAERYAEAIVALRMAGIPVNLPPLPSTADTATALPDPAV